MTNYFTVQAGKIFAADFEIKKSKFIAQIQQVDDENSAKNFIQSLRKKYFDATHNCSAWIIGDKQKSNDDGEPGGTAGNPILDALKKNNLNFVALVVTRYFGGIKLGAGGLIRAYSQAANLAISSAKIVQMKIFQKICLTIEYNFLATLENYFRQKKISVENISYADDVTINIFVEPENVEKILSEITELTAANFLSEVGEKILLPIDIS